MERLVFRYGTSGHAGETPARAASRRGATAATPAADAESAPAATRHSARAERDWAFIGLMTFTALLFFRPQNMFPPLGALHLAELSAIFALGAMVFGRLSRGLTVSRVTPELIGVLAFAGVIVGTAPFSIWMGGAIGTFTELYAKVVLIFLLMVNTLTSPKRMEQFTWLLVIASGYIAGRAVFDYVRGVNLIEYGRVQGSVGGMFKNPNDLALNMVAVLPLAALLAQRPISMLGRGTAAVAGVLMVGAIVASQSRSGTVGLAAMGVVLAGYTVSRKPGLVFAVLLAGVLALPALPSSYWERVASIANEDLDQTGSREARSVLLRESFDAFVANPLTGVGAGQFKNYRPAEREEAWRESHNSPLQVASELGIFGLLVFGFLIVRAVYAPMQTRSLLRGLTPGRRRSARAAPGEPLSANEHEFLSMHSAALSASVVGWFVCAMFASVAYHWTFYYLLALAVAPREYLMARIAAGRSARRRPAPQPVAPVGAHA